MFLSPSTTSGSHFGTSPSSATTATTYSVSTSNIKPKQNSLLVLVMNFGIDFLLTFGFSSSFSSSFCHNFSTSFSLY